MKEKDTNIPQKIKSHEKKHTKLSILRIIIITLLLILVFGCFFLLLGKDIYDRYQLNVLLSNDLDFEVNSNVTLESLVMEIKNGELINGKEFVDTKVLGKKEINLEIVFHDEIINYPFNINIIDTIPPLLTGKDKITTYVGNNIDLISYATVSDNSLEELKINVEGEYDFTKVGDYSLKYVCSDSSGNKSEFPFTLSVIKDKNNYSFTTSKGFHGEVKNGATYIEGVLIVNKTYGLPSNYGKGLVNYVNSAFNEMKSAAKKDGINLYISSGFRSYNDQKYIYNNYVKRDGVKKADTYSARAGHSEHQTGLAFDINIINDSFRGTKEAIWANNHCHLFGFILRYPEGKSDITGYKYEPWHFRYVGKDLATKLYNNGNWITLEEYFGIDSKYS